MKKRFLSLLLALVLCLSLLPTVTLAEAPTPDGKTPISAYGANTDAELRRYIAEAPNNETCYIAVGTGTGNGDPVFYLSAPLEIPAGKDIVLLCGRNIAPSNDFTPKSTDSVIRVYGKLTLSGGTVSNGLYGFYNPVVTCSMAAISVGDPFNPGSVKGAKLVLDSSKISSCSGALYGAVYVAPECSFELKNSMIVGCGGTYSSKEFAAICNAGTFTMSGESYIYNCRNPALSDNDLEYSECRALRNTGTFYANGGTVLDSILNDEGGTITSTGPGVTTFGGAGAESSPYNVTNSGTISGGNFDQTLYNQTGGVIAGGSFNRETNGVCTVTFNTDGGSAAPASQLRSGAPAARPADPTKSGQVFVGWFKDDGTRYYFSTRENEKVTENLTLTAHWRDAELYPALTPGETYYFDLSSLIDDIPGTVNAGSTDDSYTTPQEGLPDKSLHYVPFTYAGTLESYTLDKETFQTIAVTNDNMTGLDTRSLFFADTNITNDTDWKTLNNGGYIYGKEVTLGGLSYTLRAPTGGSSSNDTASMYGEPANNDWDAIRTKNPAYLKKRTSSDKRMMALYALTQDFVRGEYYYAMRRGGLVGWREAYYSNPTFTDNAVLGYRPILELDSGTTNADLKVVTLDLNSGSFDKDIDNKRELKLVVKAGAEFEAPDGSALTPPSTDATFLYWMSEDGTQYNVGATVPASVSKLTAKWTVADYTVVVQGGPFVYNNGIFPAFYESGSSGTWHIDCTNVVELTPSVIVYDSDGNVVDSEHYNVSYENNKDVGTATVTVSPKDGSTLNVTATAKFTIEPVPCTLWFKSNADNPFSNNNSRKTYTGSPIEYSGLSPDGITVKFGSTTSYRDYVLPFSDATEKTAAALNKWFQYTVEYKNNVNVGTNTATIRILQNDNPNSLLTFPTAEASFTIKSKALTCSFTVSDKVYDGTSRAYIESITFDDPNDAQVLTPDVDYTLSADYHQYGTIYQSGVCQNQDVRLTYTPLTERAKNYLINHDEKPKASILAKPLTHPSITIKLTEPVGESNNEVGVTIYDVVTKQNLVKGTDYELTGTTQTDTTDVQQTLTITGKGNYEGTVNKTWQRHSAHGEAHDWSEIWSANGTHHWHECTKHGCSETDNTQKGQYGGHVYDNDADTDCNTCGYVRTISGGGGGEGSQGGEQGGQGGSGGGEGGSGGGEGGQGQGGSGSGDQGGSGSGEGGQGGSGSGDQGGGEGDQGGSGGGEGGGEGGDDNPSYDPPVRPVRPSTPTRPVEPSKPTQPTTPETPVFTDVPAGSYFEDAAGWAARENITTGMTRTTFAPDALCTRAQIVTFLWRAAGQPQPKTAKNPFTDVAEQDYFYTAVLWAVENGITTGTTATTFSPGAVCTRAQTVTFLFRFAAANGMDAVTLQELLSAYPDSADVPGYAVAAFNWALAAGLVQGVGGKLLPNAACSRAQLVTLLFRLAG